MIRTFIAIAIPETVRQQIGKLQSELKTIGGKVRWVKPDSMHLTLKFLGEVPEGDIEKIGNQVQQAIESVEPFALQIVGSGCFPNSKRPRVLWLGISGRADVLKKLAERIEANLVKLGFRRERREFTPHLTLGRVKSISGIAPLIEKMGLLDFDSEPFEVREILVMKSDLKPTGAEYSVLRKIPLSSN